MFHNHPSKVSFLGKKNLVLAFMERESQNIAVYQKTKSGGVESQTKPGATNKVVQQLSFFKLGLRIQTVKVSFCFWWD